MVLAVQYVERRDVCILARSSLDPYALDQRQVSDQMQAINNESPALFHHGCVYSIIMYFKITGIYTAPSGYSADRTQQNPTQN